MSSLLLPAANPHTLDLLDLKVELPKRESSWNGRKVCLIISALTVGAFLVAIPLFFFVKCSIQKVCPDIAQNSENVVWLFPPIA